MASSSRISQHKLVLLGETSVGKSSLVIRFVKGQFCDYQESTIGAAFLTQTVVVNDYTVKFEIWDTAGQERYATLAPMYYRGAAAAVVVYDITSKASFERAKKWVDELKTTGSSDCVIALAGNKVDLEARREVLKQEATQYCEQHQLHFMETSAKANINVRELFLAIARKLPKDQQKKKRNMGGSGFADLDEAQDPPSSSGCGC